MVTNFKKLAIVTGIFALFEAIAFFTKVPFLMGVAFWLIFVFLIFVNNKKSVLRTTTIENPGKGGYIATALVCFTLVLVCVLPMGLAPFWNGQIPMHRNQYELLADSILEGHLYIDYDDIDPNLLAMEDPYDYEARLANQIIYHWDHAFYEGHYYMYFGVVPVFLLFIPFKILTGRTLVTFHATQFFMMFSIIAFFILFYLIAKKYFSKLPLGVYLISSVAVSLITMGYVVQAPALYCTAIISGICLELWSLLFFFMAVYYMKKEWSQVLWATIAALLGALAFGCRPPVALANLVAIPMAIAYAKNYKGKKIIRNFIIIAIPYVVVAGLLMAYNYARFENPFEFGQAYQLTSANQTEYLSFFERINIFSNISGLYENFLTSGVISDIFPYFNYGGFLVTYPLMWLLVIYYAQDTVRKSMKQDKVSLMALFLLLDAVIVTLADVHWSPGLCERYRLDAYFAVGILMFILIGYRYKTTENRERTAAVVSVFATLSILLAVFLFLQPCDANYTAYYPEKLEQIKNIILFK